MSCMSSPFCLRMLGFTPTLALVSRPSYVPSTVSPFAGLSLVIFAFFLSSVIPGPGLRGALHVCPAVTKHSLVTKPPIMLCSARWGGGGVWGGFGGLGGGFVCCFFFFWLVSVFFFVFVWVGVFWWVVFGGFFSFLCCWVFFFFFSVFFFFLVVVGLGFQVSTTD